MTGVSVVVSFGKNLSFLRPACSTKTVIADRGRARSPLSPSSSSIKTGARLQILLHQDCCDQDRRQILLDQDRRDRDCRQDRHAIVLNTYIQYISTYMSRKAGPWGYHDQRFVGCSFGKKSLVPSPLPYNNNFQMLCLQ